MLFSWDDWNVEHIAEQSEKKSFFEMTASERDADVKKFGNRMVADHSKANNQLTALAQKKGVAIKSEKVKGKWTSDKDYMAMMVKDHQEDWAEFQAEAKNGTDPDLKKWAGDFSKVIQKHLELAKQTQAKLK